MLRLLVAGRSNREIAATLFIAPKTASVHVSNILAKLNAGSRGEAAAIAVAAGLAPAGRLAPAAAAGRPGGLDGLGSPSGRPPGASSVRISSARATAPTGSASGAPMSGSQFRS